jgi:pyrophosphatase PpaX
MKQNIDTILFDLDGTLVNTYELILQSFLHTFQHFGFHQIKKEDCYKFIGPTLVESFSTIAPDKVEEMVHYYREFNKEHHDELVREFPGVNEAIQSLSQQGYKLGVVSTKVRETVLKGLRKTNLLPYFPVVITLDEVEKAKPDPEPLFKAMHLLDAKPDNTLMVGDSYHDILGAKNSGVGSVGVSWTIQGKDYLKKYNPDYVIDDMRDLLSIVGVK